MKRVRWLGCWCPALLLLVSCSTMAMDAPPLDEHTLTTANGVRFRTTSGIDGQCGTPAYTDPVGWGFGNVTVEQNGKIRKNPKFNFTTPEQGFDNRAVKRAVLIVEFFADEFEWACSQWQFAPEEQKPVFLDYFQQSIKGTFEAATRFEAAGKTNLDVLQGEVQLMDEKYNELTARRPKAATNRFGAPGD